MNPLLSACRRFSLAAAPGALLLAVAAPAAHAAAFPQPPYKMKSGWMVCRSHQRLDIQTEGPDDRAIRLTWRGRHYLLLRKPTTTGAYHFDDRSAGLVMIQIPAKSMLFDNRHMIRLADDCNPVVGGRVVARK